MKIRKLVLIVTLAAAMAGCSADPYKGRTPAPPDRLPPEADVPAEEHNLGATGSVPIGDGTESAAPNYSGYIPRVSGDH